MINLGKIGDIGTEIVRNRVWGKKIEICAIEKMNLWYNWGYRDRNSKE